MKKINFLLSITFILLALYSSGQNTNDYWLSSGGYPNMPATGPYGTNVDDPIFRNSAISIASQGTPTSNSSLFDGDFNIVRNHSSPPTFQMRGSAGAGSTAGIIQSGNTSEVHSEVRFIVHDGYDVSHPWRGNIEFNVKDYATNSYPAESALKVLSGNRVYINSDYNDYSSGAYQFYVNGSVLLGSTTTKQLTANNDARFRKNVQIDENLEVDGYAIVTGYFSAYENATFGDQLFVAGNTTLQDDLIVQQNTTLSGTLDVIGASSFAAHTIFDEKVTIGSTVFPQIQNSNLSDFRLFVAGGILTQEIKVALSQGSWPDYVFDAKYRLEPLEELEAFIDENNHLPGYKSSKEIELEGLDLKETVLLQQEKIEELTLYIIGLNKRLDLIGEAISVKNQ